MKILLLHCSAVIAVAANTEATEVERQQNERDLASTGYGFETPDAAFDTMDAPVAEDKSDSTSGPGTFRFPSPAPISFEDYEEEIRAEINEEDPGLLSFPEYEEALIMEIQEKESNTTNRTINDSNATFSPNQEGSQDPSEESDVLEDWREDFLSETPSDSIGASDTPSDVSSDIPSMVPTDHPSESEPFVPNTNRVPQTLPPAAQVHFSSQYYYTRGPTTKLPLATFSPTMHPVTTMNAATNTNTPTSRSPHSLSPEVQFSSNQWTSFNPPSNTNKPTASSLAPTFRPTVYPTSQPSKTTERPTISNAVGTSEVFKFPTTTPPIAPTETPSTPEVFSFPSLSPNDEETTTASPTQADSEGSSGEDVLEDWIAGFLTDLPTNDPSSSSTEDDGEELLKEARTKTTIMPTLAPTAPTIAPSPAAPSAMPSISTLMFLEKRLLPQPDESFETEEAISVEESTKALPTTQTPTEEKDERTTLDIFCDFTFSLFCTPKHRR